MNGPKQNAHVQIDLPGEIEVMQSSNEKSELCWYCKARPPTATYTHRTGKLGGMVCATCLDRLEVQDEFEQDFLNVLDLQRNERYDEALARMDAFLEANRHRDHDRWLARSVAMYRADILYDIDRLQEAEKACDTWAEAGLDDVWHRWMHADTKAKVLDELGRPHEALAVIEDALAYRDPKDLPSVAIPLETLVKLSRKLRQPVDPKWRPLAEALAKRYRTELPPGRTLAASIRKLLKNIRGLQPKLPPEWEKDELP